METNWKDKILSSQDDEKNIIQDILILHNNCDGVDVDPTYSIGRFWRGLPEPKRKFDINPQLDGVELGDSRHLPLEDKSVNSIMFDPPFVTGSRAEGKPGIIKTRFSYYKNEKELLAFYMKSLDEFHRILKDGGIVIFKCQDVVSGGTNYMIHHRIMSLAEHIGFYVKDLFVYTRKNVMWSPNMANQQHARKNHCYFIILEKNEKMSKKVSFDESFNSV